MSPIRTPKEAISLQKTHNSDLVIYGLARNVQENCSSAEVCFRYKIAETVANSLNNEFKIFKHDLIYSESSPIEIETGKLTVDSVEMRFWIKSLINYKARKYDDFYINADQMIKSDSSLSTALLPFLFRGQLHLDLNENKQAIQDFNTALTINDNHYDALVYRGLAFHQANDIKNALRDYNTAINVKSEDHFVFFLRGNINYISLKNYSAAIMDYRQSINLNEDQAFAYNNLAFCLMKENKYDKAKYNLEKSQTLDPSNSWLYRNWTCYYASKNQNNLALNSLEKAINLGYTDKEWIQDEKLLDNIRELHKFKFIVNNIN